MIESSGSWHFDEVKKPHLVEGLLILLTVACGPDKQAGDEVGDEAGTEAGPIDESCAALEDDPLDGAQATTISLANVGDVPLYIIETGGDNHDLVRFVVDGDRFLTAELGYPAECASVEDNLDFLCAEEPVLKDGERLVRIDPGASFSFDWNGSLWELVPIDDSCYGEPLCGQGPSLGCEARRTIAAGAALSLRLVPHAGCTMSDDSECACPPGESSCAIAVPPDSGSKMVTDSLPEVTVETVHDGAPIVIELGG